MSRCLSHKVLVFNDHCFPRINYFRTRLMRFYPRMKNVLNFEFNTLGRGVKRMRSDDDDTRWIGDQIEREIELGCMAINTTLLNEITESEIAIKPEYIAKGKLPQSDSVVSSEFLQNNVIIIMTTVKDLAETARLIANADWLKHAILAIFVDKNVTRQEYSTFLDAGKMKTERVVIIKSSASKTSTSPVSGENASEAMSSTEIQSFTSKDLLLKQNNKKQQTTEPSTSESLLNWSDSPQSRKSPTYSRSSSPSLPSQRHNLRPRQTQSPCSTPGSLSPSRKHTQSLRLTTRATSTLSSKQTSSPESPVRMLYSPTSSPSSSLPSSPVKTRPPSAICSGSEIKRSKLDINEREVSPFADQKKDREEPMDLQESEQNQQFIRKTENVTEKRQNPTEMLPSQSTYGNTESWDMEELRKAVSFQMEIQIVSIIERITSLLKSVRSRRDSNAKVAAVTTLDKLIYEIEGLLCQSVTESGIKMKEEIEKNRISPNVTTDLLSVKGVYGCGTMYDRLNVHIEASDGKEKEAIQEEVRKVTDRYNYKDTDYDVRVVKSRPTMYGRLVICSV
ncbi:uncharacterized protein LOC123526366 [Mercenaria mercenaria]|uniref:uncharacterized protein LOC123526366 n=1 Tax=Mercenaria mercenaria TaxID=6596 RepID=UPI00234E6DCA|nr:uncharacterized protein LOC123526366 [Mercenaria mercenaria]